MVYNRASMVELIEQHREKLLTLCRKYDVARLDVFGSASRDDFDPARSDLDFVVEFNKLTVDDAFDRFFGLMVTTQSTM
jgi:uncharacterized protein